MLTNRLDQHAGDMRRAALARCFQLARERAHLIRQQVTPRDAAQPDDTPTGDPTQPREPERGARAAA